MTCNFVFDIVVTRYVLPNIKLKDPKSLTVEVTLNQQSLLITSSRHNVTEFKHESRYEFSEKPKKLREALAKSGMPISVKNETELLGQGIMQFPQTMIDRIQEGMADLLHSDSCTIQQDGKNVGAFEFLSRLIVKCDDPTA